MSQGADEECKAYRDLEWIPTPYHRDGYIWAVLIAKLQEDYCSVQVFGSHKASEWFRVRYISSDFYDIHVLEGAPGFVDENIKSIEDVKVWVYDSHKTQFLLDKCELAWEVYHSLPKTKKIATLTLDNSVIAKLARGTGWKSILTPNLNLDRVTQVSLIKYQESGFRKLDSECYK